MEEFHEIKQGEKMTDIKVFQMADKPGLFTELWGERKIIAISIGPGGGWRYWYRIFDASNFQVIQKIPNDQTSAEILAVIEPDWWFMWQDVKDAVVLHTYLADEHGIHKFTFTNEWHDNDTSTMPWPGQEPLGIEELAETRKLVTQRIAQAAADRKTPP